MQVILRYFPDLTAEQQERFAALDGLRQTVVAKLQTVLGIKAKVTLAAPASIRRYEGKAKRIIDRRNENPD